MHEEKPPSGNKSGLVMDLHAAIREGRKDVIQRLLERGADPNGRPESDVPGPASSPLYLAARFCEITGCNDIVQLLVDWGAEDPWVNLKMLGVTARHPVAEKVRRVPLKVVQEQCGSCKASFAPWEMRRHKRSHRGATLLRERKSKKLPSIAEKHVQTLRVVQAKSKAHQSKFKFRATFKLTPSASLLKSSLKQHKDTRRCNKLYNQLYDKFNNIRGV